MVNSSSRTTRERSFHLQSSLDFEEVHRRLRTEHGPAAHPESEILGALAEVDKDIDEVNKEVEDCEFEIHRLQSRIIFLRNHHRCLEEHKACLRFLRSPIRKIPNETLLRIFGFSCDENELTSKKLSTMPALSISGVCARWRNLMKDFPNLWSRIRIETQTAPSKHLNLPILDLYLERSRQSPLIVNITGMVSTLQPHHSAICVTLATHSNHWKQLTVWSSKIYNELNRTLHSQKPPHFLMLEELILPTLTFNAPDALDRYQNAPNLISLSLGIIPLVNLGENKFPWKQLTQIDVYQHPEGMKTLLDGCDRLKELQLREFDRAGLYRQCVPPATPAALETLSLSLSQTSLSESLADVAFSSMTCPSLTSLFIEAHKKYERTWPKESLHAFISRSSFLLTTLSIKFIPLSDSDLIDLLGRLPSLLHLTLDDFKLAASTTPSPITPQLIQSLHAFPSTSSVGVSSALVRNLQSLELTFSGDDFNDKDFVDMVASRWFPERRGFELQLVKATRAGTTCLRSVVMHFRNREVNEEMYKPLKHLEKAGMRVVVIGKQGLLSL